MGAIGFTMLMFAINGHVLPNSSLFVEAKPDPLFWVKIFVSTIVHVMSGLLMAQRDFLHIVS